jgi:hypothetical protein
MYEYVACLLLPPESIYGRFAESAFGTWTPMILLLSDF